MATLQVRDIDDRLYEYLKTSAKLRNRSISQEVITIIQDYLNSAQKPVSNSSMEFLALAGAWKDERPAEQILDDMRKNRKNSKRFGADDGLFT